MSSRFGRASGISLEAYLSRWSALHGGVAPTGLVGLWLRLVYLLVRPLAAARVAPWVVTAFGVALIVGALPVASSWPWLAGLLIVAGGLFDSLDGALAVVRDRVSRTGALLDAVGDRLSDLCLALALWLAGAPAWVAVAAGVTGFLHEYLRALTSSRGVGTITVSERPTRIIVTSAFLLAAGFHPWVGTVDWATAGAAVLLVAGLIGFLQLSVAVSAQH